MNFSQIRGHQKVLKLLYRIKETKKLAPAYIFSGPEGIGKRLIAVAFAKNLLCVEKNADSCGNCPACIQIEHGNHPDLLLLEPEKGTITIDQIRDLTRTLSWKSFSGGNKICIVDEADQMNDHAANALLKTLEEPAPGTVIILITARLYRLLPTIISRCQQIKFPPLSIPETAELIRLKKKEVTSEDAFLMAYLTNGSPGKALSLDLDHLKRIRDEWIKQTKLLITKEKEDFWVENEHSHKEKKELELKLDLLLLWLRDLLQYKIYKNMELVLNKDKTEEISFQGDIFRFEELINFLFAIGNYKATLEYNINPQLTFEALIATLKSRGKDLHFY
ncbi:MAG: DNA polymerase III subunit delta' [Desulfobacterota bacterium]|nr:DNA polymerase III subunit delta' [Thermodesulfobacteriota bacterium]